MPPMRVEPFSTIDALFKSVGWSRKGAYVYVSPDGISTFSVDIDPDNDHHTMVVEFFIDDLRYKGLHDLADEFYMRMNQ